MTRALLALCVLFAACMTPMEETRWQATVRLRHCYQLASYWMPFQLQCRAQYRAFCFVHGLDADCGAGL